MAPRPQSAQPIQPPLADKGVTVRMVREEPIHPGGPCTCDVHPEAVAHMQGFGWRVDA